MPFSRLNRWQGLTLTTLFVGYAGYYVCRSNLSVAAPLLLSEYADQGLNKGSLGDIASAGLVLYSVGKISNGVLCDYLGGRTLFLLGMAASAICTVFFGLGWGLAVFALAWVANRYVQSMGWGAMVKIASRWFPYRVHATVMGVLAMSYLFGDAIGRYYLGWFLGEGVGWRALFFISAGTLAGIGAVCFFTLKSSPLDIGEPEPEANPANVFGTTHLTGRPDSLLDLLAPLLTNPTFWLVCIMNAGLTLIRETFGFWIPTYLTGMAGMSPAGAAKSSMLFPLVGAVSAMLAGFVSDRIAGKHGRIAVPSLLVLVAALWWLAVTPVRDNPNMALALLSGVAFFLMGPYSFCSGVMSLDLGGKKGSATAAGFIDSAGYLGALASGSGVGRIADEYGWARAFQALAGIAALVAVAAAIYWWRQEFIRPSAPTTPTSELN